MTILNAIFSRKRSLLSSFSCILGLLFLFHPQTVCAEDFSDALEKSIARYEKGDFSKAILDLKQVITGLEGMPEDEARNEGLYKANFYIGMSYFGMGKESLAKESFRKAIKITPTKILDPDLFPPKVISLYNEVIAQSLSSLSVQSNVQGAEVFLENVRKGNTPLLIKNILPGTYTVKVIAAGQEIIKTVSPEPGKDISITADFQNTGAINVMSEPSSATVFLDGKVTGITPFLIRDIPQGEHMVGVSREGYNETKKQIMVKPNETADAYFKLNPVSFSVKIHSVPENAEVFWNGKAKGTTPVTIENVTAEVHIVRIVKSDHDELLDTVDVKTSLTEKTYTLKAHTGNIFIKTEPSGAEVIMNDKKAGLTPITIIALPVKQYPLKLKKAGYMDKDITVGVLKDKTAEISESLQEIDTQPPNIMFEPPAHAARESKNTIRANVLDNQSVKEVLFMLKPEGMMNFQSVEMSNPGRIKNIYETTIPDLYLKKDTVLEYYIQACDSQNNCRTAGSKESPYKLKVHSLEPYTEGFILDVTSQEGTVKVTISLGSLDGVKKGDRYIVFRAGRELREPKSNELLQIEETFIGTIEIRELMSHTAYASVSKTVIPVTKNDRIRKAPSAPKAGTTEGNYATKIVLKWAPNNEPEVEGYRIFRSSAIDGIYQKIEEITGRDNTLYEDTDDMRDGLTFYYKISAYNMLGAESQKSEPILGRTKNVGPPPANIATEGVRVREAHLRWDTIKHDPDIKSYVVYRSDAERGQYREIAQVDSDTGTYTDRKNIEDGKAYFYKIAAISRRGSVGELSSAVTAKTKEVPNPPQNILATGGLPRMIRIQWDKHSDKDVSGYIVYRNDKVTDTFTKAGKTEKTEYLDKNVSDGEDYFYKISSYYSVRGDEIVGPGSQTVSARTKQRPKAPANVSAESGHARKTILRWDRNNEKDIAEYWVYQGKEARLARDPVAKVPVSINTFTDVHLMDNTKYYYAVKAVDSDGLESDLSNTVSALTKSLPQPPAGLNGKASQGRIHLDWKPNEETDIKGYNIYRKGWLKSSLVTSVDRNSFETKLEEKIKSITMYITAVDKDDLESEPSEEIKITFE